MTPHSPDLFDWRPQLDPARAFDGRTYEPSLDFTRLDTQLAKVFNLMKDGQARTLSQINAVVDGSTSALSARLRDLRKAKHGGHKVERKRIGKGLFSYRLVLNEGRS